MDGPILSAAANVTGTESSTVEQRIVNLISILGTKISEAEFEDDAVLHKYNECIKDLNSISSSYIPAKSEYEQLWTVFSEFFNGYAKSSDYKMFIPSNIQSIDTYTLKVDATALNSISAWFDNAIAQYEALEKQFSDMCQAGIFLYLTPSG